MFSLFDASLLDNALPYGMHAALRELTRFPKCLALPVWQQHGFYAVESIFPPDLKDAKRAGLMLVFSRRERDAWHKCSDVPCRIGGLILARYRRHMGWKQKENARGTIFFASHSTYDCGSQYSLADIHRELSELPDEFKPITVSLHVYDCDVLHLDVEYKNLGYNVVCAGRGDFRKFPDRLYENLSNCKYACSNDFGTYILYALEMGMPFFFTKQKATARLKADNLMKVPEGEYQISDYPVGRELLRLFDTGPSTTVSEEQKAWLRRETGADEQIDLDELRKIMLRPQHCIPATVRAFFRHTILGAKRIAAGNWD